MSGGLTPAQWRALGLLATDGAEAHMETRTLRWVVRTAGQEVGAIASETLRRLRTMGYVGWRNDGEYPMDFRQTITEQGRAALAERR